MYKLKNTYIDNMINNKLSSKEIDFILHIALFQDETGKVESVYYKDVCEKISISYQKFYDILNHLDELGLIEYEKRNYHDFVVKLINNDFSKVKYEKGSDGYINVALNDFKNIKFKELKAGSKLLYLYTQRFINGKHLFVANFYKDFCSLFGISKKSLQLYVRELKRTKLLFISKKRNKAYNYEMTMKRSSVLYVKGLLKNENSLYRENLISHLKINFKRYIPESADADKVLYEIANLTAAKRAKKYDNFFTLIINAINSSINIQKKEKKKQPLLNVALINQCLSQYLDRQIMAQYGMA